MTNKKLSFKALSLIVVLAVFISTFCAVLPVSAAARGAWAPNTAYAVNDTVTYVQEIPNLCLRVVSATLVLPQEAETAFAAFKEKWGKKYPLSSFVPRKITGLSIVSFEK